jgi:hypothetical protein
LRFQSLREYVIVYAPDEKPLAVIAVLHGRRNPRVIAQFCAGEAERQRNLGAGSSEEMAGGPFKPGFGLSGQLRVPHSIPFSITCKNEKSISSQLPDGTFTMRAVESRSHPGRFWA